MTGRADFTAEQWQRVLQGSATGRDDRRDSGRSARRFSIAKASVEARQLARRERACWTSSYRQGRSGDVLGGRDRARGSAQPRRFTAAKVDE
jgi:hypothetical protein